MWIRKEWASVFHTMLAGKCTWFSKPSIHGQYIQCKSYNCPNFLCSDKSYRKYSLSVFRNKHACYCTAKDYVCLDCSSHFSVSKTILLSVWKQRRAKMLLLTSALANDSCCIWGRGQSLITVSWIMICKAKRDKRKKKCEFFIC